ncbi:MAG: hypothetical protein UY72_C0018G0004 [Candidatus Uhrbacteria bacterium GW2011_GWD2_52_7]|uniref:Antitoxin n=1 Tax=Candidatus Uhrbacteria bacterium GW2011_GWD2_52_7 TaxID=1618989 RepID=A0A0G2ACQ8_9BACT|nr:MAG: hypothetical protein UY72_C0018G0004 [Candidatus Uhrbacteria bacterium GW2011_GWD2_52_7]
MQNEQFSRLLRLASKTGDRLIVTDPNGRDAVVILPLDEYEALVDSAMGPSEMYEVPPIEEADEAEFDPEALQHGALKGLWERPTEEEVNALEVIERPEPEEEPVRQPSPEPIPVVGTESNPLRQRQQLNRGSGKRPDIEGGEEQFYLEPI